jgi:hypothetical protein
MCVIFARTTYSHLYGYYCALSFTRAWDKIADHLKIGQDERFAIPIKAGGLYNVGKVIQIPDTDLRGESTTAYHVRIDVKDAGIQVVPGSHVGILYESSAEEVHKTLLAFADGDANKATVGGMNAPSNHILLPADFTFYLTIIHIGSWRGIHGGSKSFMDQGIATTTRIS